MKDSQGGEAIQPASAQGPGRAPSGIPLTVRLGEREYAALVRIARGRDTTAAALVEQLVLHALNKTDVPPPADSHPARKHTSYEQATAGFRPDAAAGRSAASAPAVASAPATAAAAPAPAAAPQPEPDPIV